METYLISMGFSVIFAMLKNPDNRRKYENALKKLRDALNLAFPFEVKQ